MLGAPFSTRKSQKTGAQLLHQTRNTKFSFDVFQRFPLENQKVGNSSRGRPLEAIESFGRSLRKKYLFKGRETGYIGAFSSPKKSNKIQLLEFFAARPVR